MYSTNIPINQELATLLESNNVSREAKTVYTI